MEEDTCRICMEGGTLISPCLCKGTMKYVHESCLTTWRNMNPSSSSYTKCNQCAYPYQFQSPLSCRSILLNACVTLLIYTTLCHTIGSLVTVVFSEHVPFSVYPILTGIGTTALFGILYNPFFLGILVGIIYDHGKIHLDTIVYYSICFSTLFCIGVIYITIHRFRNRTLVYKEVT
jgi:E3 ubiquitin-protein ligase DOA10